jgi:hypothetical protein
VPCSDAAAACAGASAVAGVGSRSEAAAAAAAESREGIVSGCAGSFEGCHHMTTDQSFPIFRCWY